MYEPKLCKEGCVSKAKIIDEGGGGLTRCFSIKNTNENHNYIKKDGGSEAKINKEGGRGPKFFQSPRLHSFKCNSPN